MLCLDCYGAYCLIMCELFSSGSCVFHLNATLKCISYSFSVYIELKY